MPSVTNRHHEPQTFNLQFRVFWSNYTRWLLNCPKTIMAFSGTHWWLISLILIVMILMITRESCWCTHCSIVGHKSLCRNWFLSGQLVIIILNICLKSLHGDHKAWTTNREVPFWNGVRVYGHCRNSFWPPNPAGPPPPRCGESQNSISPVNGEGEMMWFVMPSGCGD